MHHDNNHEKLFFENLNILLYDLLRVFIVARMNFVSLKKPVLLTERNTIQRTNEVQV